MAVIMSVRYVWGHGGASVRAQLVGEAVVAIAERDGCCTPAALVELARPKAHPLHSAFEWNNRIAAEQWRVQQARQAINSVRCVNAEGKAEEAPAFVHIQVEGNGEGYAPLSVALTIPYQSAYVVEEALAALRGIRRRYQSISELAGVWSAIDAVI